MRNRNGSALRTPVTVAAFGLAAGLAALLALPVTPARAAADQHEKSAMPSRTAPAAGSILDAPGRPEADKKQDAGRKPLQVYSWVGVRPGMTVGDLFCSGGYNTSLLSHVVGDSGKVYSVLEFYADKEAAGGRLNKIDELKKRIADGKLTNVAITTHIADLPAASLDAAIIVRNYHDVEWVFPDLKRADVVKAIYTALKPGGVVGIVDVATPHEGWDKAAHRLNEKVVISDFEKGGFKLAGSSDMLRNPNDDHTKTGFKEGRYNMDRYLLKFQKPEASM